MHSSHFFTLRRRRRPYLRVALQTGKTPEDIITSWQAGLAAFREARRPYLLYGDRPKSETGN